VQDASRVRMHRVFNFKVFAEGCRLGAMLDETIAAIATPLGEGGLAVIRISGKTALAAADACFQPLGKSSVRPSIAQSHTIQYGHVVRDGKRVDEVLLAVMHPPRTFTGEHVVEITCHGGMLPAKLVLDAVLASGARTADLGGQLSTRAIADAVLGQLDN